MRITWPALRATLEAHTVAPSTGGPRVAGFLVRCTSTQKDLGYVWAVGHSWRWQLPTDGPHYGERSSQRAAVQVLRDAHDLTTSGCAQQSRLPLLNIDYVEDSPVPERREPIKTSSRAAPVQPPTRRVVWATNAPDLTASVAAAFRKER